MPDNTTPSDYELLMPQIENWFTYHPPKEHQIVQYKEIRNAAMTFAEVIARMTPQGDDQRAALQKLRECVMLANATIACEG